MAMNLLSRMTSRLPVLALLLSLGLGLLAGCAKDIPPYLAPELRSMAPQEKPWPANQYLTLAYHAVQDNRADQTFLAVRTDQLLAQLSWLRDSGYRAVSVDQILAARDGGAALPARAVLLTFDDGYQDFYTRVLPMLRSFNWPAVVAPVGTWLDTPDDREIAFGELAAERGMFLNRDQLQRSARSPLVEVGAHTFAHHKGIQGNPQGNNLPAIANRQYLPDAQRYETTDEFEQRVREDVRSITQAVTETTGRKPRVWVWPYGAASGTAQRIIREAGYELFLTLDDGLAEVRKPEVPRMLMSGRDDIGAVAQRIGGIQAPRMMRVAHVDLDYVYDADPQQLGRNLDQLVQRMSDLRITTVFLQAFSDPVGDGLVRQVYFPNRLLPVRADLFNRVAWQLKSRTGTKVYAWMPVLSVDLDASHPRVQRWDPETGKAAVDPAQYQRLSPFHAGNREAIGMLYEDLAAHAAFDGLLFHDDALLSDFEDAGPDALRAYAAAGLPGDLAALRADPAQRQAWSRVKSRALVDFTLELTAKVRAVRGASVLTARNIFAQPVLDPRAEEWFAQNPDDFLAAYDWTAPMAMPLMEGVSYADAPRWLDSVVDAMRQRPGALERTVFELQSADWRDARGAGPKPIDSQVLAAWMRRLQLRGATNFGYYPDDFVQGHPRLDAIAPQMSTAWLPAP
jgi:biofilm PGA synthesis lipoprotein PgaB